MYGISFHIRDGVTNAERAVLIYFRSASGMGVPCRGTRATLPHGPRRSHILLTLSLSAPPQSTCLCIFRLAAAIECLHYFWKKNGLRKTSASERLGRSFNNPIPLCIHPVNEAFCWNQRQNAARMASTAPVRWAPLPREKPASLKSRKCLKSQP